jgi:hypothetical protein
MIPIEFEAVLGGLIESMTVHFEKLNKSTDERTDKEHRAGGEIAKGLDVLTAGFRTAALAATGIFTCIVASGAPTAFETLTKSFQLVAIQIANFFLPAVLGAAYAAQLAADWLQNLDPESKELATQFATVAAIAAAVTTVFNFLSVGLATFVVVVGAVVYALRNMGDALEWMKTKIKQLFGFDTPEEKRKEVPGGDPTVTPERRAQLERELREALDNPNSSLAQEAERRKREGTDKPVSKQDQRASATRTFGSFAMSQMKELQPRFSPVEDVRKQLQLSALKDPLEAKTWQAMRDQAALIQQLGPKVASAVDKFLHSTLGLGK